MARRLQVARGLWVASEPRRLAGRLYCRRPVAAADGMLENRPEADTWADYQ